MRKDLMTLAVVRGLIRAIIDIGHFDHYLIELHKIYVLLNAIIENGLKELKELENENK